MNRRRIRLKNCPIGLFLFNHELCVKTEYEDNNGTIKAYIVSSGEHFWGGVSTGSEQRELLVHPVPLNMLRIAKTAFDEIID